MVGVLDHPGADQGKKSRQAEIRHDDHHAEQQNQRFVIDGSNRLVHGQYAKRDHETGADDGRTRAVYPKPGQSSDGEHEVGPKKNKQRSDHEPYRHFNLTQGAVTILDASIRLASIAPSSRAWRMNVLMVALGII